MLIHSPRKVQHRSCKRAKWNTKTKITSFATKVTRGSSIILKFQKQKIYWIREKIETSNPEDFELMLRGYFCVNCKFWCTFFSDQFKFVWISLLSKLHPLRAIFIDISTRGISGDRNINIFNNSRKEKAVRFCPVNDMILGNVN